jgi:hypothetical protein
MTRTFAAQKVEPDIACNGLGAADRCRLREEYRGKLFLDFQQIGNRA